MWRAIVIIVSANLLTVANEENQSMFYSPLQHYMQSAAGEFGQIGWQRKIELAVLAEFVKAQHEKKTQAQLTFICTYNSRRSHMAQI